MEILKNINEEKLEITLKGRLDTNTSEEFEKVIDSLEKTNVVLDLSQLDYISSSGLRCILRLYKSTKELKVLNPNDMVYEVFEITGFVDFLDIERS